MTPSEYFGLLRQAPRLDLVELHYGGEHRNSFITSLIMELYNAHFESPRTSLNKLIDIVVSDGEFNKQANVRKVPNASERIRREHAGDNAQCS